MSRSSTTEQPRSPRGPSARPTLTTRKRGERQAARRLVRARTRQALTDDQRAHDPLWHPRRGPLARAGLLLLLLLLSAAIHLGIVRLGTLIGGRDLGRRESIEQTVRVEVREPPPLPPPPVEEKRPEPPKPEPIVKKAPPPPQAKTPPPPAPKGPPPRVVGLNLDSTVEGGGGPAFATGDTRNGQTADRATAVKPAQPDAPAAPPKKIAAVASNQVASRIPVAGVQYTAPKRRRPHDPAYPETLKTQGIEADVTVMVSIDAEGKVTNVKIIRPATYPEFNEAAEKTAREEEFEPASRDGTAIPYTISYTYRFRLETP